MRIQKKIVVFIFGLTIAAVGFAAAWGRSPRGDRTTWCGKSRRQVRP
jgi:hypothetical protein